jgi:uncharacterized membrane protein YdjX (TVP38/TMEM64 family)
MTDALSELLHHWSGLGTVSGIALALVFFSSGLILVPRTFLCLAAGALYGMPAIPIILFSTTAAGMVAFLLARHLFRDWLQRRLDQSSLYLRVIADAIDEEGWRIVGLLRFGSPIPTAVQNYLFGLTRIGLLPFTLATFAFTIPQVVLYVSIGAAGRSTLLEDGSSPLKRILMGVGLLTMIGLIVLIAWRTRQLLRRFSDGATIAL